MLRLHKLFLPVYSHILELNSPAKGHPAQQGTEACKRIQEMGWLTCAGNESKGIISWLHVLPEVNVGVVEDVLMKVEVVEALRGQHHTNVITCTRQQFCFLSTVHFTVVVQHRSVLHTVQCRAVYKDSIKLGT